MIKESSKTVRSDISDSAKIFYNCRVRDSSVGELASIGDDSIIIESDIADSVEIGRRNIIRQATIGRATYTGSNCNISHANVGSYCAISWNVSIGGADHNYQKLALTPKFRITHDPEDARVPYPESWSMECRIGNDVWLASGVCVLRGVSIGDGCVIGANSVVTRDIPPYSIAVGVPARVIRRRFSPSTIAFLEKNCWWCLSSSVLKAHADLFDLTDEAEIVQRLSDVMEKYGGCHGDK